MEDEQQTTDLKELGQAFHEIGQVLGTALQGFANGVNSFFSLSQAQANELAHQELARYAKLTPLVVPLQRPHDSAIMWEIIETVADTTPYVYNDNNGLMECLYCNDFYGFGKQHKHSHDHEAECIWLKAATLVQKSHQPEDF